MDIEHIDENRIKAIKYSLTSEEKNITDLNELFLVWSNKESYIKCLGLSLSEIRKISGLPLSGTRNGCYTKSMIYDGYSLSITIKGESPFEINIKEIKTLNN